MSVAVTDSVRSPLRTPSLQPDSNLEAFDAAKHEPNTNTQNDPSRSSPLRMLKEVDTFQRINNAARELQRLSQQSDGDVGAHDSRFSLYGSSSTRDEVLLSMRQLSSDIARDIGQFHYLDTSTEHAGGRHRGQKQQLMNPPPASITDRRTKRRKHEACCSTCSCIDTPKWRRGPEGPATLCNVCGLLYAKRQLKLQFVFGGQSVANS